MIDSNAGLSIITSPLTRNYPSSCNLGKTNTNKLACEKQNGSQVAIINSEDKGYEKNQAMQELIMLYF